MKLEVFDPPMCCATGICGNNVDPKLITFASDLEWLKKQGVDVVRYGLSFEPAQFVKNEAIKNTLQSDGNDCLPIVVADGQIASKACYPSRAKLAGICKLDYKNDFGGCATAECDCSNAPAEENCCCGPECDCHKSNVSVNFKKILFVAVILLLVSIIAFKLNCKCKAGAVTLYKNITSISQIKPSQEVAFIYISTPNNEKISSEIKEAMLSAQKTLKNKNISASIFLLNPKSPEYAQVASKTAPPAVLTIYKGKGKNYVSGTINQTRLLQSYMAATQEGACGAGCPCHKKQ